MSGIGLDGMDHMPNRNETRERCRQCFMATLMFPVVNAIPDFVSIKIETVSKVIMGIRIMLQMFETKVKLFKVNNRDTTARCKICLKLAIKTPECH